MWLVAFAICILLIPVKDASNEGRYKCYLCFGTGYGLSEREQQRHVAVNTMLLLKLPEQTSKTNKNIYLEHINNRNKLHTMLYQLPFQTSSQRAKLKLIMKTLTCCSLAHWLLRGFFLSLCFLACGYCRTRYERPCCQGKKLHHVLFLHWFRTKCDDLTANTGLFAGFHTCWVAVIALMLHVPLFVGRSKHTRD